LVVHIGASADSQANGRFFFAATLTSAAGHGTIRVSIAIEKRSAAILTENTASAQEPTMGTRSARILAIVYVLVLAFLVNQTAFGQARNRPPNDADAAAGCACCGSMLMIIVGAIVLPIVFFGINVAILFWVAKDAKSRGMDGAMWIFLVLFTGVLGLAIYLFSRPQGLLVQCDACGNNRMEVSAKCPHCGNA
jgi:hypothetical protein